MARKPIREKLMCQKLTARKKEDKKDMAEFLNNSLVNKYSPNIVSVPNRALTPRSAHGVFPKTATEIACRFMKSPSRPLFSG